MKEVNLRKAAQISNEIQVKINQLASKLQTTVAVKPNAALDTCEFVESARKSLDDRLETIHRLLSIKRNIRRCVAAANDTYAINDILGEMATIDSEMKILNGVIDTATPAFPWEVYVEELNQKAEELKMDKSHAYNYRPEVNISLTYQSFIDEMVSKVNELKGQKNSMSDDLIRLNVSVKIDIVDIDWEYLTKLGIV